MGTFVLAEKVQLTLLFKEMTKRERHSNGLSLGGINAPITWRVCRSREIIKRDNVCNKGVKAGNIQALQICVAYCPVD